MILTGQPFTEAYTVPNYEVPHGDYILGLDNGIVVLHNLSLGDSAIINRSQVINDALITFDENWSRTAEKVYKFSLHCQNDVNRLKDVLRRDHAMITRLMCKDWIEYGLIDPTSTTLANFKGKVEVSLAFITLFEVGLRKGLTQCTM